MAVRTVRLSLDQFADRLGRIPGMLGQAVIGGMRAGLLLSLRSAKNEYILSGGGPVNAERLTNRTGKLRSSISMIEPRAQGGDYIGGLRATAPYAGIHERGGKTRPHTIKPKNAKVLSWMDNTGVRRFAHGVRHPGSRIPARPYLLPAIEKNVGQIEKQIAVALEVMFGKALS